MQADDSDGEVGFKRRKLDSFSRADVYGNAVGVFQLAVERETDPHRIAQRIKQIEYGKNTLIYTRYRQEVRKRTRDDPQTPDIFEKSAKRAFDGKVKAWRRALHAWDAAHPAQQQEVPSASLGCAVEACEGGFDNLFEDALENSGLVAPRSAKDAGLNKPAQVLSETSSGSKKQISLRERLNAYKSDPTVEGTDDSALFEDFLDAELVG
ncbi:hypothetical protein AB1Y20_001315 [Prymnesium parvum]|uniref:Histone RNA hairpin-binding protein RNA-binding domain-containing protein n=1 Tax=Prymnesium parvum TaxID=97485 RepID=A0AB34KD79_PRYPA